MRGTRRIGFVLLLSLLILDASPRALNAKSPNPAPQQKSIILQKSIPELIINNIPGILTGTAGILTAIFTYLIARYKHKKIEKDLRGKIGGGEELVVAITKVAEETPNFRSQFINIILEKETIKIIKDRGHLIDDNNYEEKFEMCLNKTLIEEKTLNLIKMQSNFLTKEDLPDEMAKIIITRERVQRAIRSQSEKVAQLESMSENEVNKFIVNLKNQINKLELNDK